MKRQGHMCIGIEDMTILGPFWKTTEQMKPFKFLRGNPHVYELNNIYEQSIISIYRYCCANNVPFIGYEHRFTVVDGRARGEIIRIGHIRYQMLYTRTIFIDYVIITQGMEYQHVFAIDENDFVRLTRF